MKEMIDGVSGHIISSTYYVVCILMDLELACCSILSFVMFSSNISYYLNSSKCLMEVNEQELKCMFLDRELTLKIWDYIWYKSGNKYHFWLV